MYLSFSEPLKSKKSDILGNHFSHEKDFRIIKLRRQLILTNKKAYSEIDFKEFNKNYFLNLENNDITSVFTQVSSLREYNNKSLTNKTSKFDSKCTFQKLPKISQTKKIQLHYDNLYSSKTLILNWYEKRAIENEKLNYIVQKKNSQPLKQNTVYMQFSGFLLTNQEFNLNFDIDKPSQLLTKQKSQNCFLKFYSLNKYPNLSEEIKNIVFNEKISILTHDNYFHLSSSENYNKIEFKKYSNKLDKNSIWKVLPYEFKYDSRILLEKESCQIQPGDKILLKHFISDRFLTIVTNGASLDLSLERLYSKINQINMWEINLF